MRRMKMFPAVILVLPLVIMATHCAAATRIISVAELITACEHNRPPCDGSPNREVAVAGEIFMLNTNAGSPYVSLRGKDHENVQCFFTKEFAKQDSSLLSKLHPGDEVAIAGNLEGKTINVIINKCDWLRVIRSPDELDHSIHDHPHLIKELFTKY